jgi:hypothetical protein
MATEECVCREKVRRLMKVAGVYVRYPYLFDQDNRNIGEFIQGSITNSHQLRLCYTATILTRLKHL